MMEEPSRTLRQRLLSGGFWVIAGRLVTITTTLVLNAVLARILTLEQYGAYVKAFSIMSVAILIGRMGMAAAVVRVVAEAMGRGRSGQARSWVRLSLTWSLAGTILVATAIRFSVGSWLADDVFHSVVLASALGALAAWIAIQNLQVVMSEVFRGFQDYRSASVFGGSLTGILAAASLTGIWLLGKSAELHQVLWILAGAAMISMVGGVWLLARRVSRLGPPEPVSSSHMFHLAGPLWINGLLAYVLNQADIWILGSYYPDEALAPYGAAARIVALVAMPMILTNMVVAPIIAELYFQDGQKGRLERVLRTTAMVAGAPAFLILLVFVFFGSDIMVLIFTELYRAGGPIVGILSVGKLSQVLVGAAAMTLSMSGNQKILLRITMVTSALTVLAAWLAVDRFGPLGVASAISSGVVFQSVATWLAARRQTGLWTHIRLPGRSDWSEIREIIGKR